MNLRRIPSHNIGTSCKPASYTPYLVKANTLNTNFVCPNDARRLCKKLQRSIDGSVYYLILDMSLWNFMRDFKAWTNLRRRQSKGRSQETVKYRSVLNFGLYTAISFEGRLSRISPHLGLEVGWTSDCMAYSAGNLAGNFRSSVHRLSADDGKSEKGWNNRLMYLQRCGHFLTHAAGLKCSQIQSASLCLQGL